jgi:predicted component of type VI protein secretion system
MIVLSVIRLDDAPCNGASARFDERGGTIGRAEHNRLVLPDPTRRISRVHATVVYRDGQFTIVDNGSNPVAVNGRVVPGATGQHVGPGGALRGGGAARR